MYLKNYLVKYEEDHAMIRFMDEVGDESILWLVDEVNLAVFHYGFRRIVIKLASPGGSVDSLFYLLHELKPWRGVQGLRIETQALTRVSSAAAMILSLVGTIGYRTACPSAHLLYHEARIVTQNPTHWTQTQLTLKRDALAAVDRQLLNELAAYVLSAAAPDEPLTIRVPRWAPTNDALSYEERMISTEDELVEVYAELARWDRPIPPEAALGLRLIDHIEA